MGNGTSALSRWQRRCLTQLQASASQLPDTLSVTGSAVVDDETGMAHVPFTLSTSEIEALPHGLQLEAEEAFVLAIGVDDERPPVVYVEHFRFLGHPHVLSGYQFCLYLDETREWDPEQGINGRPNGVLNRLWRFLVKAARAEFNANAALYHAVGGLPHISRNGLPLPPIVVRDLPQAHGRVASGWLAPRSDWCLELHPSKPDDIDAEHMPVFFTDQDLPFGAGRDYLIELTARIALHRRHDTQSIRLYHPNLWDASQATLAGCSAEACPFIAERARVQVTHATTNPTVAMLTALAASAARKPDGTPQTLLLAVPHPTGEPRHLIAVYFEAKLADHLRLLVKHRNGPLLTFDHARLDRATPLKWCYVSDERATVTTRRDTGRPVSAYQGKTVVIWGVGGLGSWAAEHIVRAGATKVIVCDNSMVTGGLLVRQNYTDQDIGASKADRLAERLRTLVTGVDIESRHQINDAELKHLSTSAHLILDATINRVITRRLDAVAMTAHRTAVIAQVFTDARTGTLGLAMVYGPQHSGTIQKTDLRIGTAVEEEPALEPYQVFWKDPEPGDEFIPTRGCSLPTFHGSAADLAAVAASLTTVIAPHLEDGASGTHLIALPHSGTTPSHKYLGSLGESSVSMPRSCPL